MLCRLAARGGTSAAAPLIARAICALAELGEVEIVRVTSSAGSALWRGMMDAHHYLKSGPLCGAQLRYLVRSERYGWIGGLSYSACARRVECRDVWSGWTETARRRNHMLVVNNSRFLIPPSVRVQHLASFVLARCQRRLCECLTYNHPLGNNRFQEQVETTLGKCVGQRQRGRSPTHVDAPR